jgi:multiple sugar transport system substrate-binding protein
MTLEYVFAKPTRRGFIAGSGALFAGSALSTPAIAQSVPVTIITNFNNPVLSETMASIAQSFTAQTGVEVVINDIEHEANKTAIRSYLTVGTPDICFWFSGNRMRAFVERGLFDDISDLFARDNLSEKLGVTQSAVTVNGAQYGLPLGGILWGLWYRRDVFEENGWTPPATWSDLLALGEAAKSAGMTPISMGTKDLWPTGGFFDHLSLRMNGLDGHMALMNGQMSYTDPKVLALFEKWGELLDAGMFPADHPAFNWEGAGAALHQKRAALVDLGGFIKYAFPEEDHAQLAYAPFPEMVPGVGKYEDFSVDSVHIPTNAPNKEGARDFLSYFYGPENLANFLSTTGGIPPRNDIPPSADPIVNSAVEELKTVDGTAQYYDRDTDPDMAREGLKGFQEFMARPERRDEVLERLEGVRARIFG